MAVFLFRQEGFKTEWVRTLITPLISLSNVIMNIPMVNNTGHILCGGDNDSVSNLIQQKLP